MSEIRVSGRSARDRIVDAVLIVLTAGLGVGAASALGTPTTWPAWLGPIELVLGALTCVSLWWRRGHPIAVATILVIAGAVLSSVSIAPLIALYTVALTCSTRAIAILAAVNLVSVVSPLLMRPDIPASPTLLVASNVVGVVAATAFGLVVRSRRELVESLRERAAAAEVEAMLRAAQAEHEAREELAREMHDVLGHRLSLLSVQAGALSYNRDVPPEDAARAVEEIRSSSRKALQDLREVLDILRAPQDERPMPGTRDLPALVVEANSSGTPTRIEDGAGLTTGAVELSAIAERTLYRFVQEGLTNVRKHAPGAETTVRIDRSRNTGLEAEVVNGPPATPGARGTDRDVGSGLRGLAERAALVGGSVEHAPTIDGGWRLALRLPGPS
ncbi:histidine kinase [Nonomuraea sp. NPDC046802]|uniref:sensor histidine kinase n=1 Tax=Nonomuraea sp. NPDC046802 TaxID=3154919 RepID=UPI00340FF622